MLVEGVIGKRVETQSSLKEYRSENGSDFMSMTSPASVDKKPSHETMELMERVVERESSLGLVCMLGKLYMLRIS